jgi:hypothetical protein
MTDIPVIPAPMSATLRLDNIGRQRVDELLVGIALQKAALANAPEDKRDIEARRVLALTMQLAAHVAGDDTIDRIYGALPEDAGRQDQLGAITARMLPLVFLYGAKRMAVKSPGSLASVLEEMEALWHGDEPRLFARLDNAGTKGKPTNARRMAKHKLRALQWNAYLEGRGVEAWDRNRELHAAFNSAWPVIAQWRDQVVRDLGPDTVARQIDFARSGLSPFDAEWTEKEWRARLTEDAAAFIAERWRK